MKKLVLVVAVLGVMACKKKEEPAPEMKKYVYTRTPGEVTQIVGDIFVDTGGTVFTVKGKGFDPKRKKFYHLLLGNYCAEYDRMSLRFNLNGYLTLDSYVDTASIVQMTDSIIKFVVKRPNLYSVRENNLAPCVVFDSARLEFAVTSLDSTKSFVTTNFNVLNTKKVKNKYFFNIVTDTVHWHMNSYIRDKSITLDDVFGGGGFGDLVSVYLNGTKLNTSNTSSFCFAQFDYTETVIGDVYLLFDKDFYNSNKGLGLTDGFYNVTMKESKTGLPIEERHGKKGIYVKFVN